MKACLVVVHDLHGKGSRSADVDVAVPLYGVLCNEVRHICADVLCICG